MEDSDMPTNIIELVRKLPNYVRNLDDFKLDHQIGEGGFGSVWFGIDKRTKPLSFNAFAAP